MENRKRQKLFIIDGNSYIYRAFYAIRSLSTSHGLPTNAVFGFANMLLKVIKEKNPDMLAIAFDPKGPTRRHGEFKEYKAHRPPMPRDLVPQIPYIHKLVEAFRIPVFIKEGQEADDVIATLAHVQEITRPKLKHSLTEFAHLARLSRELARLHEDVPVELDYASLKMKEPDNIALLKLFRELEFTALLKYITQEPEKGADHKTVLTEADFQALLSALSSAAEVSVDTETTSLDPLKARLVGISFSVQPHQAYYLPLGHTYTGAPKQISLDFALSALGPILGNPSIKKIGQNLKYDLLVLGQYKIAVQGAAFDTMIASYLLNPSKTSHGLEAIALEYLNYKVTTYTDVTGSGKHQIGFNEVDIETATRYSGEDADIALRLKRTLGPKLEEQGLGKLFREIEMPLMEVLVSMERNGVKVDADFLGTMSKKLEKEAAKIEKKIYELAGVEFNINSPKQLAEILFEKLKLTPTRRTKTGFSTNVDVLEELAQVHPLPAEILTFRTLSKLKSTYVDALPAMINPGTGRLRTSFNQAVTATGRLSSSDPNLQNIPIRTDVGREIRRAFIAERGARLLEIGRA